MGRNTITWTVVLTACTLLLTVPMSVRAQPFGMTSAQTRPEPQYKVLSSGRGRYVFGQISDSSKDKFMLDTLTGRLWEIAQSGEIGIFLRTVPYRDAEGKCSPLPESISECMPEEGEKK
jgi:hypothetical protein